MTELRIRNIEDWIVEMHRHNAKLHDQTLESELRQVLLGAALSKRQQIAKEIESDLESLRTKYGVFPSSIESIRETRERVG